MKKMFILIACISLFACKLPDADVQIELKERSIGFNTALPELKWHLGTDAAIQIVKDLDALWASENYDAMKSFFTDTSSFVFDDGFETSSTDEFLERIKADDNDGDVSWTFDYAFSVDLDPSRGGEHVQAGFTLKKLADGVETVTIYHESYYIVNGKIVTWRSYSIGKDA